MEQKEQAKVTLYLDECGKQSLIDGINRYKEAYLSAVNSKPCDQSKKELTDKIIEEMDKMIILCKNNGNIEFNANEVNFNAFAVILGELATYSVHFAGQRVHQTMNSGGNS